MELLPEEFQDPIKEILLRFTVILRLMECDFLLKVDKVEKYCMDTYLLILEEIGNFGKMSCKTFPSISQILLYAY